MEDMSRLYQQHAQTVYKFLLAQCRDAHLAEELTQETFYQAIRSVDRFNGSCKVSVWLCQIAKHLWYQHLRKHRREAAEGPAGDGAPLRRGGNAGPRGAVGTTAENPCPVSGRPGGGLPALLRRPLLPGDRGCVRPDGDLGPSDLLPEQGITANRRNQG